MSDDDLDALFDQFEDDIDLEKIEEEEKKHSISNTPASKQESTSDAKLREELEEMKRKMKEMQDLLEKHKVVSPEQPKPKTPAKTPAKKPSLADKFKGVLDADEPTKKTPNKTPPSSLSRPSNSLSSAFGDSLVKPKPAPKTTPPKPPTQPDKIDKCPHSGIRISNRVIAKSDLNCAVATRKFIKINHLPLHFKDKQDVPGDWVTCGVIVRKVGPYKSSSGNDYSIWTLSDLVSADNVFSLFLFKDVHIEHRKEQIGTVVALLNPNFMPPRDQEKGKKSDLAFTLDNSKKLLRMGMATDYGTCRNITKGGQHCNNFINKALTQYCDFHVVKIHAKIRNKRIALSGNSFTPQPAQNKFQKQKQENQAFVHKGKVFYPNAKQPGETLVSNDVKPFKKQGMVISTPLISSDDFDNRLKIQSAGSIQLKRALDGSSNEGEGGQAKRSRLDAMNSCKSFFKKHVEPPKLGSGMASGGVIDLNKAGSKALLKAKALNLAKQGAFPQNNSKKKRSEMTPIERAKMKERSLGLEKEQPKPKEVVLNGPSDMLFHKPIQARRTTMGTGKENKTKKSQPSSEPPKKKGILSAAFGVIDPDSIEGQKIFKAQSMNSGALKEKEMERTTDYFNALEKFEYGEEKLLKIQEMKVTVYACSICKSATSKQQPKCIEAGHLVKKGPAVKKFFKCKHCSQRTDVIGMPFPDHVCEKCGRTAWGKCSMYHEKKGPKLESERLVVRAEDVEVQDKFR